MTKAGCSVDTANATEDSRKTLRVLDCLSEWSSGSACGFGIRQMREESNDKMSLRVDSRNSAARWKAQRDSRVSFSSNQVRFK